MGKWDEVEVTSGTNTGTKEVGVRLVEHEGKCSRKSWRVQFEAAIQPLASSVTVSRHGLPPLDNTAFRALVKEAKQNPEAAQMVKEYLPRIHVDAGDVIDLIKRHPEVGAVFDGEAQDTATNILMPWKEFRMELNRLAERVAKIAVLRGEKSAVEEVDQFLTLASRGQLPGFEVSVIRGIEADEAVRLVSGAFVTTYSDAVERGLARSKKWRELGDFAPDYEADRASVVVREMTWSPTLANPRGSGHGRSRMARPKFVGNPDASLWIVLDFLALVTEQRVEVAELLCCAPQFTDIDPNFAPGSSTGWASKDQWPVKELTDVQVSKTEDLLQAWRRFSGSERWRLELGLARLVSSVRRGRERFWLEDRILDVAVALEVLYELDRSELTYKLSTRAAYLLGDGRPNRRVDIFKAVKDLYGIRSGIVHGRKPMDRAKRQEAIDMAQRGFEIGRETLVEVLTRGKMPDWNKVALAAE